MLKGILPYDLLGQAVPCANSRILAPANQSVDRATTASNYKTNRQ